MCCHIHAGIVVVQLLLDVVDILTQDEVEDEESDEASDEEEDEEEDDSEEDSSYSDQETANVNVPDPQQYWSDSLAMSMRTLGVEPPE